MTGTAMVVSIVFILVGFGVMFDMYIKHLEFKETTLNHNNQSNKQAVAMMKQVKTLEERMQVLENIATDKGYDIKINP
ncbi:MAG: phage shock protein C [Psychroserpens sp.]|jgi:phage shock protein C